MGRSARDFVLMHRIPSNHIYEYNLQLDTSSQVLGVARKERFQTRVECSPPPLPSIIKCLKKDIKKALKIVINPYVEKRSSLI